MGRPKLSFEGRFWDRVVIGKGCWLWNGTTNRDGYGRINSEREERLAHRVSWEIHHGKIPNGMWVLHRCDNPPCCNPAHLFLGTNRANTAYRHSKGRDASGLSNGRHTHPEAARRGVRHWAAKMTDAKVLELRHRRTAGATLHELALSYGLSVTTTQKIAVGKSWTHVTS